jgi:hypothetical protein
MGWLKEWDKCVFKRANPVKKRRFNDGDEEDPYVRIRACPKAVPADYRSITLADQRKE